MAESTAVLPPHAPTGLVTVPAFGVPEQGTGGAQVKVRPEAGMIVLDVVTVAPFVPPAVVLAHEVAEVRLLNAVFVAPRRPTCVVRGVPLVAVHVP